MLNSMTYEEFNYWVAYYSVEPFPEERSDLRNAQLASILVNLWRGKDSKAYEIDDFLFDFWGKSEVEIKPETPEVLLQKVLMLKEYYSGMDLRGKTQ